MPNVPSTPPNAGGLEPQLAIRRIASLDNQPNPVAGPDSSVRPKEATPSELKAMAREALYSMLAIKNLKFKFEPVDSAAVPEWGDPTVKTTPLPSCSAHVEGASPEESASSAE
ncbi:hypothetical protein RSOLAG22IIIB_11173 [Rhizoctonia solani]|uniref:Uncharacterized protein n=1 Tax=Rhizoctonia solani TaxID=456999 RepID=A0A0K6G7N2_9AGAM|nr:hypothetical protein RSOLAG22IIIB_11173 [Rhizoctonia solani]